MRALMDVPRSRKVSAAEMALLRFSGVTAAAVMSADFGVEE